MGKRLKLTERAHATDSKSEQHFRLVLQIPREAGNLSTKFRPKNIFTDYQQIVTGLAFRFSQEHEQFLLNLVKMLQQ